MSDPLLTGYSRVFLIEGGARPDHSAEYQSCARAGGADKSFGDVTSVECPDPSNYDQYITQANLRGAAGRATMDLVGRYFRDAASTMLYLANRGCRVDAQVHFGECTNPSAFNTFEKILVLEDALFSNWSTGDLGAMDSEGRAAVDETGSISAADIYEVLTLNLTEQGQSIVTNEVVDVVICDTASCGECEIESTGCDYIYAVTVAAGGSPSTPADIVHTPDRGVNWYADDIDSLGVAEDPTAVACHGDYIVVSSNDSASLHYALKSEVDTVGYDETWTEVATGIVAGGEPNDLWSYGNWLFVVGDGGYIYAAENDPTSGVSVLDAGSATSEDLRAVHAISDVLAVAVGDNGAIVYTTDRNSWAAPTASPVGGGTRLNCVWMHSELVWVVGDSNGVIWYTTNRGETWTQIADFGAAVYDIAFATDSVGYAAYATATPRGGIRRTYDGGNTWVILPEGTATIAANDRVNAVAACEHDVNFVVGVGLADDGSDGFIVMGAD
jgi:hypothetical protein